MIIEAVNLQRSTSQVLALLSDYWGSLTTVIYQSSTSHNLVIIEAVYLGLQCSVTTAHDQVNARCLLIDWSNKL